MVILDRPESKIVSCPACHTKNRTPWHRVTVKLICAECKAALSVSFGTSYPLGVSRCWICSNHCPDGEYLSNAQMYHESCYTTLRAEISTTKDEINSYRQEISRLNSRIESANSIVSRMKRIIFRDQIDVQELQLQVKDLDKVVKQLDGQIVIKTELLKSLYDHWPTYPPDWEERIRQVRSTFPFCEQCDESYSPLHVHHKIPISKGGNHTIKNLIVLCEDCHSKAHGGRIFSYLDKPKLGAFPKRLQLLKGVVRKDGLVHFSYRNKERRRSVRSIKPAGFKRVGQTLCVHGYCYLRKEDRTFAVKRMRGAKEVSQPGQCYFR